jgi:hypothetical protein
VTELEMYKLAARAANWRTRTHGAGELQTLQVCANGTGEWRPFASLQNDVDAMVLAAAARIDVSHYQNYVAATGGPGSLRCFTHQDLDVDQLPDIDGIERRRAMRRAITECAALLGRDYGPLWWRSAWCT